MTIMQQPHLPGTPPQQSSSQSVNVQWVMRQSYLYMQCAKFRHAIVLLRAVYQLDPRNIAVIKSLCYSLIRSQRFSEAKSLLKKYAQICGQESIRWPEYYLFCGQIMWHSGKKKKARQLLDHYIKLCNKSEGNPKARSVQ